MQSMQCPTAADPLNLNNHPRTAYILGQVIQFHLCNFIKSNHIMLYYAVSVSMSIKKGNPITERSHGKRARRANGSSHESVEGSQRE